MAVGKKRLGQTVASRPPIVAGVLIGGQSRRMGSPKALLPHGAGTLIEHVVSVAGKAAEEVVLLGGTANLPESLVGYQRIADDVPGQGPLGGLCTLLRYAGDRWALLLACDMPGISAEAIQPLVDAAHAEMDAVAYRDESAWHPCCALYHPRLLALAQEELYGARSLHALLRQVRTAAAVPSVEMERALTNVNSREEWEAWRLVH